MSLAHKYETLVNGAGRDLKQAMRECEKKLKKSPKDAAVILFKAQLLFRQRQYDECLKTCSSITSLRPIVADLEFIRALYRLWYKACRAKGAEVSTAPELSVLFENLLKGASGKVKRELLVHFFRTSSAFCYWEDALRAIGQLLKVSPEDSRLYFIQIVIRQLLSSLAFNDNQLLKRTHAGLAHRLLMNCVNDPSTAPSKSPLKAPQIRSREEVGLFFQVLREQGRFGDMKLHVKLIDSLNEKSDFQLLLPEIYLSTGDWDSLWDVCREKICLALDAYDREPQNSILGFATFDWKLWNYYSQAVMHSAQPKTFSDEANNSIMSRAVDIAEQKSTNSSVSRSAFLAAMLFAKRWQLITEPNKSSSYLSLVQVLVLYAKKHLFQSYFFNDIRQFVENLPFEEARQFLSKCQETTTAQTPKLGGTVNSRSIWLMSELNCLKLDFLLYLSRIRELSETLVCTYISKVIRFVKTAKELDVPSSDAEEEACMLAVAAFEKLRASHPAKASQENTLADQRPLMQALLLLHYVLQRNAQNYLARIWYVRLARNLGLISVAIHHYGRLGIREIQQDTLSHLIFHDISLLHPFAVEGLAKQTTDRELADPYQALAKVINWYDAAEDRISSFLAADIDNYRYDKMKEFDDLKWRLNTSVTKHLSVLERRRIARLTDRQYDETDLMEIHNRDWFNWASDKRDFSQYPHFYCSNDRMLRPEEVDTKLILANLSTNDCWQSVLHAKDPGPEFLTCSVHNQEALQYLLKNKSMDSERKIQHSHSQSDHVPLKSVEDQRSLRLTESVVNIIQYVLMPLKHSGASSHTQFKQNLASLQENLRGSKTHIPSEFTDNLPEDFMLRHIYTSLETSKSVLRLLDLVVQASKNVKHELHSKKLDTSAIEAIRTEHLRLASETRKDIENWRTRLQEGFTTRYMAALFNDTCGKELEQLVGRKLVESALNSWKESALDSLGGILKIKVP